MRLPATFTLLLLVPMTAAAQPAFQSPSGNIHCTVQDNQLRCRILQQAAASGSRDRDCVLDSAGLRAAGRAMPICDGETVPDHRTPALAYGEAWRHAGLECAVTQASLRCTNTDRRGFEMSRARGVRVF